MSDDGRLSDSLRRWQAARDQNAAARAAVAEELLRDLLLCYEERREEGQAVSPEALCQACPELLPALEERIQQLKTWNRLTQLIHPS
jgi:hypothetical protein